MLPPKVMTRVVVTFLFFLTGNACGTTDTGSSPAMSAATVAPPSTTQAATVAERTALTDAITRYQAVYSSVYNSPRQDLAIVDTVAAGAEATSLRDQAAQLIAQGIVSSGAVKLLRLRVDSVSPSPVAGGPTSANVTTCEDVSANTGLDRTGKSIVNPNRLPQTQATFQLENPTPDDAAGWRVTQGRTGPTIPCDPL
jgi:hypothetical protein